MTQKFPLRRRLAAGTAELVQVFLLAPICPYRFQMRIAAQVGRLPGARVYHSRKAGPWRIATSIHLPT